MLRIPILPNGMRRTNHEVAVQKPMLVKVKNAKALGKVITLKSRCMRSSQFLAYMNLHSAHSIPFALVDEVSAEVEHLSVGTVLNCQTHEALHSRIVAVCVKSIWFVQLHHRLFGNKWILRLVLARHNI